MQYATAIEELEHTIRHAPPDKRLATLRAITKLFLANAPGLCEEKVDLFDSVFGGLLGGIELSGLTELSDSLAPIENAPRQVIKRLARDPEIAVAKPVLIQSPRLSADDLVEIAQTKSKSHLLAISNRPNLPELATDVLIKSGDRDVIHDLAQNTSARFSDLGMEALFEHAAHDAGIAAALSGRPDVPPKLFRESIAKALEKLETQTRAFAAAQRLVITMKQEGRLGDAELIEFAATNCREEVVAALSVLSGVRHELVEALLSSENHGGLLIICKALGTTWRAISAIMKMQAGSRGISAEKLHRMHSDFVKLSISTAERVVRFWQVRQQLASL